MPLTQELVPWPHLRAKGLGQVAPDGATLPSNKPIPWMREHESLGDPQPLASLVF